MSFPAYEFYKESGVDWLDEVPSHWSTPPLYSRYEQVLGKMLDQRKATGEHPTPYVRNVDVQWDQVNSDDLPYIDIDPTERERFTVKNGDLLICEGGEVGRTAIWNGNDGEVAFQKAIHRLRPRDDTEDVRFFYYTMRFATALQVFLANSNPNTIPHLTGEQLKGYRLPKPPLDEQKAISSFLDVETSKIDGLVSEQRRLIELLKEKRQAVISHAVTKGLNPNAPMKPSGIQWLGDVPLHWEIRKVSHLFRANKGKHGQMLTKEYLGQNEGDYPVYSGQTENNGVMGTWTKYEFDFGDDGVLFSTTVGAKAMHLFHLFGRFSLSQNCMIIAATDPQCDVRFFYYHFQPLFAYERAMIPEHMQASFRMDDLYTYRVAMPSTDEQQEIAKYLDGETQRFDELQAEAERAIELLQERRTALISAAVTGKIDVRQFAPC